ncbi:MAG: Gmad2 immunoglobulin-like domain-containing protein [bacterium]
MNFNIKFIYAALIITIVGGLVAHSLVQHAQDLGDRLDNANQDSSFVKPEYKKGNLDMMIDYRICNIGCITKEQYQSIQGNKNDLKRFSIYPGQKISGEVFVQGEISGGYFFEGNILINILDINKKILKAGHISATSDWMTSGVVSFEGKVDTTDIVDGSVYIEIHNDNASDDPKNEKSILIPVIIEN